MKLILDTQVLIWWANDVSKISTRVRDIIVDLDNELWVSIASVWEMQIKISLGKLDLPRSLPDVITTQIQENQIKILPIELSHIYTLDRLPLYHRDPLDRIIIAQSIDEQISIACINKVSILTRSSKFGNISGNGALCFPSNAPYGDNCDRAIPGHIESGKIGFLNGKVQLKS